MCPANYTKEETILTHWRIYLKDKIELVDFTIRQKSEIPNKFFVVIWEMPKPKKIAEFEFDSYDNAEKYVFHLWRGWVNIYCLKVCHTFSILRR